MVYSSHAAQGRVAWNAQQRNNSRSSEYPRQQAEFLSMGGDQKTPRDAIWWSRQSADEGVKVVMPVHFTHANNGW